MELWQQGYRAFSSQDADLVILGFRYELLKHVGKGLFLGFDDVGDILFVRASGQKMLATEKEMGELTQTLGEEELGRALEEGKPT